MANTTRKGASNVHGTNPQYLIEKVIRARIYDSVYWKEHCFALNAASLIDKAIQMKEFMCLTLKLLQLQPEKEILVEYLLAEEFKYLRALAAFYIRLVFRPVDVYELLEPLYKDYRKLREHHMGGYNVIHFDTFIDSLLREERRSVLEETEGLRPYVSPLDDEAKAAQAAAAQADDDEDLRPSKRARTSMSRSPSFSGSEMDHDDRERYISRSPSEARSERYISRSPSRSVSPDRIEGDV